MRNEINQQLQSVRSEMAMEKSRMLMALDKQNGEMLALMQRANEFEVQSQSARQELERVRAQIKQREADSATLDLMAGVPASSLQLPQRGAMPQVRRCVPPLALCLPLSAVCCSSSARSTPRPALLLQHATIHNLVLGCCFFYIAERAQPNVF